MRARNWDVVISCPRPAPRVSVRQQAWHLEPERIQRSVDVFFPKGSSLELTRRTVRLRTTASSSRPQLLGSLESALAVLLQGLYFETGDPGGGNLPSPVRFEFTERTDEEG